MRGLEALPTVGRYLEGLPRGIESHPQAMIKGSAAAMLVKLFPDTADRAKLPPILLDYLERPPPVSVWVPEVPVACLALAIRDLSFEDDKAFADFVDAGFLKYFGGRLYQAIMSMSSPDLLAKHGPKRWGMLRRGSTRIPMFKAEWGNVGRVEFADNLFSDLYADVVLAGFKAAYRLSRARTAECRITELTRTTMVVETVYFPTEQPRPPHVPELDALRGGSADRHGSGHDLSTLR